MRICTLLLSLCFSQYLFRLSIALLFLIPIILKAQTTSWIGGTNNRWRTASNWTNGVPDENKDVIIGDEHFTGPNEPVLRLIFGNGSCKSLTVGNHGAPIQLTVNDVLYVYGDIVIGPDGTLVRNSFRSISVEGDWLNSGNYSVQGFFNFGEVRMIGDAQTIGGGSVTNFRNLRINIGSTVTLDKNISLSSRLYLNGTLNPTEFNAVLGLGQIRVYQDAVLVVKAATFSDNYRNTLDIYLGSSRSIVDYASATIDQTIDPTINYRTLQISGGMTKSLIANTQIRNNLFIRGGTLDLKNFRANRNTNGGALSMSSNTFLKIGGNGSFPSKYNSHSLAPSSTVEYYGDNQVVTNEKYGHLILSSSNGDVIKTMPTNPLVVSGDFSTYTSAGTLSFTAGNNIKVLGNISLGENTTFFGSSYNHRALSDWINDGSYVGPDSRYFFNGTNATLSGLGTNHFGDITFRGNGIHINENTSLYAMGDFSTIAGGTVHHDAEGTGIVTLTGSGKSISGSGISFDDISIQSGASISTISNIEVKGDFFVDGSFSANSGIVSLVGNSKTIGGLGSLQFAGLNIPGSITTARNFSFSKDFSVSGSFSASNGEALANGNSGFSGTADLYDLRIADGSSLTMGAAAIMRIAGKDVLDGSATLDVVSYTPNTIDFNGLGAQDINFPQFHNLVVSNGNTKTATAGLDINGTLTINSGTTFDAGGAYKHFLGGDFINDGDFTARSSTVEMDGTVGADIEGVTAFNNLTINKEITNVVDLDDDISVINLDVRSGNMHTGSSSVTITSNRTGNGIILGTIIRTHAFLANENYMFEGPNNYINFSNPGSVSSITVVVTPDPIIGFPNGSAINREYDIDITGAGYTALLRLHYEQVELNGNSESALTLWRGAANNSWVDSGKNANNEVENWVELHDINDLISKWTLSEGALVHSWNGSISTSWSDPLNWSGGVTPSFRDEVIIGDLAFSNQPEITSNVEVKGITFGCITPSHLTIGSGSLTVRGNIDGVWKNDANHTIDVGNNSLSVLSDLTLGHDTAYRFIDLLFNDGHIDIHGNLNHSGGAKVTCSGAGNLEIGGDYIFGDGTFSAGLGTVTYFGAIDQEMAAIEYHHLTIAKTMGEAEIDGTTSVNGNLNLTQTSTVFTDEFLDVRGNVVIDSGTTLNAGSSTIWVGKDWKVEGSFIPGLSTVVFNGVGEQKIDATTFKHFDIDKPSGIALLTGDLKINGNASVSSGKLDAQSFTLERTTTGGTASISAQGYIYLAGKNPQIMNFETVSIDPASTTVFYGSETQNIRAITFGHLVFSNGGSNHKIFKGSATVAGDLTINAGASLVAPSTALTLEGNLIQNGSFDANSGTLNLNGIDKDINGSATFYDVNVNGDYEYLEGDPTFDGHNHITPEGIMDYGNSTVTMNGDYTNEGSAFTAGTMTFTGQREQTIRILNAINSTSTGVVNFNGSVAPTFNSNTPSNLATVQVNNTSGLQNNTDVKILVAVNIGPGSSWDYGPSTATIKGHLDNRGTITGSGKMLFDPSTDVSLNLGDFNSTGETEFGGTGQITLNNNDQSFSSIIISNTHTSGIRPTGDLSIGHDLMITSGAKLHGGAGLTHTIAGSWTNNGVFHGESSTISFDGLAGEHLMSGGGSSNFNNLTIENDAYLTIDKDLSVSGNFTNDSENLIFGDVEVSFEGSSPSVIKGSSSTAFSHLTLEKDGANVTLNTPTAVTDFLDMVEGNLISTSSNMLTLADEAIVFGASDMSFVDGPIAKVGDDAFEFPVGNKGIYAPILIDAPSNGTDEFTAEYFHDSPHPTYDTTLCDLGLSSFSSKEYWILNRTKGSSDVNVTLTWNANSGISGEVDNLSVVRWDGSQWRDQGSDDVSGDHLNGSVKTSAPVKDFSPFTLARNNNLLLPIELVSFKADVESNSQVKLSWITMSETNNDFFTVEKSLDGTSFTKVGDLIGAGNSNEVLSYEMIDFEPFGGVSYYRLKQTDFNGAYSYSQVVPVKIEIEKTPLLIYPNPASNYLIIEFSERERVSQIDIYDQRGRMVEVPKELGDNMIRLDVSHLGNGLYIVKDGFENYKFMIAR